MKITLNGNPKELSSVATLTELLTTLQLAQDTVVIELNTLILKPDSYEETKLSEGDQVEIIRFVGGG